MATAIEKKTSGTIDPERGYTFEEIAEMLSVSPRQITRWVQEGWIGYKQLPRGRRILGKHYLAFIDSDVQAWEDDA
jgi:excisionase family DNA binding protein